MSIPQYPLPAVLRGARTLVPALLAVGAVSGCIHNDRGLPLYGGDTLPEERVARLVGPIERVDGKAVPGGTGTFELMPGCHLVQIGGSVGTAFKAAPEDGWVATIPRLVYAFPMRAGHSYSISFEPAPTLGKQSVGTGRMLAREDDRKGHRQVISPARTREDVAECVRLAASAVE